MYVTINVLWLFLTVPLVGLKRVIVVFLDIHFLFSTVCLMSFTYSLFCISDEVLKFMLVVAICFALFITCFTIQSTLCVCMQPCL